MFTYVRVKGETTMFGLQEIKAMNEAHCNGKKINEVGDAEACLYLYTLNLTQSVSHETGQIYIYLASKLCKRQGIKLESFMKDKVKEGLNSDEERELRK